VKVTVPARRLQAVVAAKAELDQTQTAANAVDLDVKYKTTGLTQVSATTFVGGEGQKTAAAGLTRVFAMLAVLIAIFFN